MINPNEEILGRDKDVAEYCKIGRSTVWYFVKKGLLHPKKLSPRITIFLKSDVDAFIHSRISDEVAK